MEELIELVLKVNKVVRIEIPKINHGGCGVFASLMYKQLKALGYEPNIVILTGLWDSPLKSKKEILNNLLNNKPAGGNVQGVSFAHCCIEVSGFYFDGEKAGLDFRKSWDSYKFSGHYTIEELDLALKVGSWNDDYNRRKKNPTVKKIIRNATKKVYFT